MDEINLLKQNRTPTSFSEFLPKALVRIFALVLLGLIGYYIWLFIDFKNTEQEILTKQAQINLDQQAALVIPRKEELFTRQQQIKQLSGLIGNHPYWSKMFPELARVTLRVASYDSLKVGSSGDLDLSATVPTLPDLAKYMQVFDLEEFNNNFSDIRIAGFSKVLGKDKTYIQFNVRMKFNPELITFGGPKKKE